MVKLSEDALSEIVCGNYEEWTPVAIETQINSDYVSRVYQHMDGGYIKIMWNDEYFYDFTYKDVKPVQTVVTVYE